MRSTWASMLIVAFMSASAFGQLYSNSFEYEDWNAATADGWSYINANSPTINFPAVTQHTGASPTDGQKTLEISQQISGGIRKTIFDQDVSEYVISFDWYVLNPNSSVANGAGSKGYDSFFRMTKADGTFGVDFRVSHFNGQEREIEPGVIQPAARALNIRRLDNGTLGPADWVSYPADGAVREARFFEDGWNKMEIYASPHPELGGDWLRYYLNGAFVGESTVNWFGWSAAFSNIHFGWSSLAGAAGNIAYFDNFRVDESPGDESSADFDVDGDVDGNDFLIWQRGSGAAGGLDQGDANDDGQVDELDLDVWKTQFVSASASAAASAVPEPSALALALISSAGLAGRRIGAKRRCASRA